MMTAKQKLLALFLSYAVFISLVTFAFYGADKSLAKSGKQRISEKTLLLLSVFGGGLGGLIGMSFFRHKTRREHWYFKAVNVLSTLLYAAVAVCIVFVFKF